MSEPTSKELLERIKKIDAVLSSVAHELAEQREDIEEIRRVISLMNERFKSIERPLHDYRDLGGAVVDHNERLHGLEAKLFPNMWPTIGRIKSVVGDFDERYDLNHPLDQRKEKKP
jgi:predicted  nucleic acid-binding Zn-ribbon protein